MKCQECKGQKLATWARILADHHHNLEREIENLAITSLVSIEIYQKPRDLRFQVTEWFKTLGDHRLSKELFLRGFSTIKVHRHLRLLAIAVYCPMKTIHACSAINDSRPRKTTQLPCGFIEE